MNPLIERLRHGCGDVVRDAALMSEAADEIERLRSALIRCVNVNDLPKEVAITAANALAFHHELIESQEADGD